MTTKPQITPEWIATQRANMEEIMKRERAALPGPMYAVADEGDTAPENEEVWTISPNPDVEGWRTDSGCPGYGLFQDDAEFYAHARTDIPNLIQGFLAALDEVERLSAAKDTAYRERQLLVAFLTSVYPSHLKTHPKEDADWENDWRNIVCFHTPMGQMTWHIHDSELKFFETVKRDETCKWDGHSTEEKYRRLMVLKDANDLLKEF